MIIKIGGVEINKDLDLQGIEQLQDGLSDIGVNSVTQLLTWVSELSLTERVQFAKVVNEWGFDTVVSFMTFGLF